MQYYINHHINYYFFVVIFNSDKFIFFIFFLNFFQNIDFEIVKLVLVGIVVSNFFIILCILTSLFVFEKLNYKFFASTIDFVFLITI